MPQSLDLFIAMAEIAGVFVGFGALISVTRRGEIDASQLGRIRAVVTIGLVVVVAALVPVVLAAYGVADHTLWFVSSSRFLIFLWVVNILSIMRPENRAIGVNMNRSRPVAAAVFLAGARIASTGPSVLDRARRAAGIRACALCHIASI